MLIALLAIAFAPVPAATAAPADSAFATRADRLGIPGGAVAHIDDGTVTRTEIFGHDGNGNPVNGATPFLWGSVSKPVAAAVVKRLADEGTLNLDAPASTYADGAPDAPVGSLLDHTAGLGFGAELLDVDRPEATASEILADPGVADSIASTGGRPGEHHYSSLGYLVLQAVIEGATGGTYQDAVAATPGAMDVGASSGECAGVPRGHRLAGPFAWPMDGGYDGAGAAYGYACGSIGDLAEFAVSQLDSSVAAAARLEGTQPTSAPHQLYGQGWRISAPETGPTTVWHTGTVPGYFSAIYLDPESGDGAVVLLNASGYLHEEVLAALTASAFGGNTAPPAGTGSEDEASGVGGMAVIVPAALLGLALLALVLGWLGRRAVRARTWVIGAVAVTAAALIAAPLLMGVPLRYFWLWEPGIVIAAAAIPVAMLIAAVMSVRGRRRRHPASPTSVGRQTPAD
ncbi:serine hydrolase domain-containing protein [Corynebacterium sp. NPDC060344]|uniref:serine hydrolase domain-containing protein n=1 Tax=Corynebacterium sp. NPDC060344 TaxID=3347101 RepID=UPI0036553873